MSARPYLKVHTKALHTLDRPFKCEVPNCGMTYMTRLDLDRHMKKHNKWEQKAGGVLRTSNKHSTDVESPPPPHVCTSFHP